MGIGGFKAANLALLAKWGWKFKSQSSSLWCKVIKAIHVSTRIHGFLPIRKSIAGYWKPIVSSILKFSDDGIDFKELITGVAGDGETISFWHDPWLDRIGLKDQYPALYNIEKHKSCLIKDRVHKERDSRFVSWQWKKESLTLAEISLVDQLHHRIQMYRFKDGPDGWLWLGNKAGSFSCSSMRLILEDKLINYGYMHRWFNWVPKKTNIFTWKAAQNRIPMKSELLKRGVNIENPMCLWCSTSIEIVPHSLVHCERASQTWNMISNWCNKSMNDLNSVEEILSWASNSGNSVKEKNTMLAIVTAGLWNLWKARNLKEYEDRNLFPEKILEEIKTDVFMWLRYKAKMQELNWEDFSRSALYML